MSVDKTAAGLKDRRFRVEILGLTPEGEGLGAWDGTEVHVFGALPGETVEAVVRREKKHYLYCDVCQVVSPSPQRIPPRCRLFGECTGCQWQHMDYAHQLEMKRQTVLGCFRQAGLEDLPVKPTLGMDDPWHYRNHARFTVGRRGDIGFVNRETRRMVPVDQCLIMHSWINGALGLLLGHGNGLTQVSVRYGVNTGEWLVQPRLDIPGFPLASGQKWYTEEVLGHRFRVSSPSFFQVNSVQAEQLVRVAAGFLELRGDELLLDAYAGVGTFAVALSPHAGRVLAMEESASAVMDARENIQGIANVALVQARVETALANMTGVPDAVVLDPPRSGCSPEVIAALGSRPPRRLVYVSCDPGSLARDVSLLRDVGFTPAAVQPVDMFPQTRQVECVALLEKRV